MKAGYHALVRFHGVPAIVAISVAIACTKDPEVRAQTVLVIDTDLSTVGAPGDVPVGSIDTLRIDVLDGATVRESRQIALFNPSDLPVSIGLLGAQRLRLRVFRASRATASPDGGTLLEPTPEVAIDRIIDVAEPPNDGAVHRRRVLLTGECLGFPSDAPCASSAVTDDDASPTHAGSWHALSPAPCPSAEDEGRPCVPGSFDIVGDLALVAYAQEPDVPAPLRAVVIRPFRMDKTEFTVGRYRALRGAGYAPAADPIVAVTGDQRYGYCTFISSSNATKDQYPLNCVTADQAADICRAAGGRLPTEAEWEHAARGRDGRAFPWGDTTPDCCTTSTSRAPLDTSAANLALCGHGGLEPVGSHVASPVPCAGVGDISRDGVLDLGGSLEEFTSDGAMTVSSCRPSGLAYDPACELPAGSSTHVVKGDDFTGGPLHARAGFRTHASGTGFVYGFRCVYPESP